jgi:diacylglycerol kinase (ATP)
VIGVIFNPTARGEKAAAFRDHLSDLGSDVRVAPTRGPGDARPLAAELVAEGCDLLVAAGGDGTVNEVLNGLAEVPAALPRVRLGVIPLGTINVFAKETGIPEHFPEAWKVLRAGRERLIDLPVAEFIGTNGRPERRHFILMAGAGLDSRAISLVNWKLKKKLGPLAYVWAGVQAMNGPRPELLAEFDGEHHRVQLAEVGNGRFYGGRYVLFPDGQLDSGRLEVTLFPCITWPAAVRIYLRLLRNRLAGSPEVIVRQTRQLTLNSAAPLPFHLDGDVVGQLPATVSLQPRALRVVVP